MTHHSYCEILLLHNFTDLIIEKRYYISNLIESAQEFGARVRAHWSVESMHWTLDVTFKEDDSRANVLHAAVNLGSLRRAAINIVKSDPTLKKLGMAKNQTTGEME